MRDLITLLASTNPTVAPYLLGTFLGLLIGGLGHLMKEPLLIVLGIVLIAVTSMLFLILSDPSIS